MIDFINLNLNILGQVYNWLASVYLVEGVSLLHFLIVAFFVPAFALLIMRKIRR